MPLREIVNPGAGRPYVNFCTVCWWAGSVALWSGGGKGAHCPKCKSPTRWVHLRPAWLWRHVFPQWWRTA